jgi:hypothetical protein
MQKLLGLLIDFGQRGPFLKAFRHPLVGFLQHLSLPGSKPELLPQPAQNHLKIWNFASDATGAYFGKVNGRFILFTDQDGRRVASISVNWKMARFGFEPQSDGQIFWSLLPGTQLTMHMAARHQHWKL